MGNKINKRLKKVESTNAEDKLRASTTTLASISFSTQLKKFQNISLYSSKSLESRDADCSRSKSLSNLRELPTGSSLSTSRSYLNFSQTRQSANISHTNASNLDTKSKLSKTYWPVPYIESTFLPQFKIVSNQFQQKYSIETLIDRGAFGTVFKVRNKEDGRFYALKVLSKSKIISDRALDQLKNEVDIQQMCSHHPFIVECLSYWQTHRKICLLTELVTGGELFGRINCFPLELIKLYVAEIAIALDFLHNAGIIYRDLKPDNILLDDQSHIKLIDFGLSKWLKIGQRTNTFCGTLQYMAPEILTKQYYGHSVDWWALGIIVCLMFVNEYPKLLKNSISTVENITNLDNNLQNEQYYVEFPAKINQLPPSGRDLLARLLEVDPKHRIKSLMSLKRIAIYMGYSFEDVISKKISPIDLMPKS